MKHKDGKCDCWQTDPEPDWKDKRIAELEAQQKTCTWKRQKLGTDWDEYDSWGTTCGEDFAIVEEWHDKPTKFCSNCGGKTIEALNGEGK